ncbi:DnaJ subfamily C member 27 [Cichlidogyrus casuarinus]|uniref:DnaJ subfamily C member 27 n=1 Tax=Cichlidogyrus casuarinus TaxID=1844966 RepID=A0ABD2QEX9_9PLAT
MNDGYTKERPRILKLKLLFLGDTYSGKVGNLLLTFTIQKTCLIKCHCEKRFVTKHSPTIGIDYGINKTKLDGFDLRVNIFDTSGHPIFYEIRREFYKFTTAVILVFDVTNRSSFLNLSKWMDEFAAETKLSYEISKPIFFLLANKVS